MTVIDRSCHIKRNPLRADETILRSVLACAVLVIAIVSPCASQERRPLSIGINVGAGFGGSSAPHGPSGGASVDAVLAFRPKASGFVIAASGSGQAFGISHACDVVPGGSCTPEFPEFWIFSALAGWETKSGTARVMAGPAVATAGSIWVGAAQARLELAKPITSRLALLASARFNYIPEYRDDSFQLGAFGIGLRLR